MNRSRCRWLACCWLILLPYLLSLGCARDKVQSYDDQAEGHPDTRVLKPPPPELLEPEPAVEMEDMEAPRDFATELPEPEPVRKEPAGEVPELQTVYFAFDSAELSDAARRVLDDNAAWMRANPGYQIQVQGHCDERGTVEYNLALGDRRAKGVKGYLVEKWGIDADRLHTISYGEERPLDPSSTDTAWARNRRVQFFVY